MRKCCDHNECDPYQSREFVRARDSAHYWENQAKKLACEVAKFKLDADMLIWRDKTDVAWLQGKVVAQARELKRLNDKSNAELVLRGYDPNADVEVESITRVEVGATIRDEWDEL